eukprot:TRINITY_DN7278_c0_g1_i4.p1 TRINITY_DN7278_c0_g1~~TRINITY_DN7278_c0_g1_i4.p1  ORF type:complete len:129 (+),score=14.52 TRINITY_DN7278_c0_g1_i4:169-555(+)
MKTLQFFAFVIASTVVLASASTCDFECLDTSGFNEVCGSDAFTYRSRCELQKIQCLQIEAAVTPITFVSDGPCAEEERETLCDFSCLDNSGFNEVCDSNRVSYVSQCHFEEAQCRDPTLKLSLCFETN